MTSPDFDVGPRFGLRALKGDSLVSDIDAGFAALRDDAEAKLLGYSSGLDSALPAAGTAGRLFRATDTRRLLFDNGTTWDALGLAYVVASASVTAKPGQAVLAGAASAITITLPVPAANMRVAVIGNSLVTAAQPVTVQVNTGLIFGPGMTAGVGSFKIGVPGSGMELISDGTNWWRVAGEQDTGWVALTLKAGVTAVGGAPTPAARLYGHRVEMRGTLHTASGSAIFDVATVATGLRPLAFPAGVTLGANGGPLHNGQVALDGTLTDISPGLTNSIDVYLEPVGYAIS